MTPGAGAAQPVIVLAAGQGKRFGGPKLFARYGGQTFLERILERCRESGARVTLVCDPRQKEELEALLARIPPPFPRIVEADGSREMLVSVQAALRAGPYAPGFWLWPVDAPFLSPEGWRHAAGVVAGEADAVWKLRADGRTGHPVWIPADLTEAILAGTWPDGLRGLLRDVPGHRIRFLQLEGERLGDVNTPEQLGNV